MATPWSLSGALRGMFVRKTIDEETWEDLEDALISADFAAPDREIKIVRCATRAAFAHVDVHERVRAIPPGWRPRIDRVVSAVAAVDGRPLRIRRSGARGWGTVVLCASEHCVLVGGMNRE